MEEGREVAEDPREVEGAFEGPPSACAFEEVRLELHSSSLGFLASTVGGRERVGASSSLESRSSSTSTAGRFWLVPLVEGWEKKEEMPSWPFSAFGGMSNRGGERRKERSECIFEMLLSPSFEL